MPTLRHALAVSILMGIAIPAAGHSGGLNTEGCHNDRKNGGYHCHRGGAAPVRREPPSYFQPVVPRQSLTPGGSTTGSAYANCTEARAAGAAPVRRGEPGYGPHLDRDNDGIGCEPYRGR